MPPRAQRKPPEPAKTKKRHRRPKYSSNPIAVVADEESLGPAMRALPPRLRQFVMELALGPIGYGGDVRAARAAGLGTPETPDNVMRTLAYDALHTDRVQAAMKEVGNKQIRASAFKALSAIEAIALDPEHKDQLKAALALVDRGFPIETSHHITVEKVDHTRDALKELEMFRRLGVTREKLERVYGVDGLFHLERQLDGDSKLIEVKANERTG